MPQLFRPSANSIAILVIASVLILGGATLGLLYALYLSPYVTEVKVVKPQPVPFSHEHHVGGIGIDCRYCHHTVEVSHAAGIPPVATCYNCHKQIWGDAPMLKPVRDGFRENKPIPWTKVHDLPDFAYFNHSSHVNKGVGCATCHGQVNEMPLMWKQNTLYMAWCLNCHRQPEENLRPVAHMTDMHWVADEAWKQTDRMSHLGVTKTKPGHINQLTNCGVCHR